MAIMPKGGELFARLHLKVGADIIDVPMKASISWHLPFQAADHVAWGAEVLKYVEVGVPYVPRVQYGPTASASRIIPVPVTPVVQKGPTNAPKPPASNVIPFNKDSVRIPQNQKTVERKHLSKRERRVARRKEALEEVKQQELLESAGAGSIKTLYSHAERLRVPRMTQPNVQILEDAGMQAVYMGDTTVHFMAQMPDGTWSNVTYEDAWLLKEDLDTLLEEVGGMEHSLVNQTDVKTRKLNDKVTFSTYSTKWEELAEHKYVLQAIEVPGFTEVFLTDTEMEAVNSVASGKLSCDDALSALPDYETPVETKDVPTEKISKAPEIGSPEDSKLTEKAMDLLAGGPEVLILESDN